MEKLKRIRARITTLSLAANLPPMVWSELCLLDSEMAEALKDLEGEIDRAREAGYSVGRFEGRL